MLRFTGLSVVETVKKLENASVGWYTDHEEMKVLKARKEGEDQTS